MERSRIDNLLTAETLDENSELIDIRTGYNGTVYESAGTSVRSQVNELKGDLDEFRIDTSNNLDSLIGNKDLPISFIENEYVNNLDGKFIAYIGWHRTDYIKIPSSIKSFSTVSNVGGNDRLYNAFYDINKQFIESFSLNEKIDIPIGAEYVVLSTRTINTLSINTDIKSIEDIKNYTISEITEKVNPECLVLRNQLPNYYTDITDVPTSYDDDAYIDKKIKSVQKGKQFLFITDVHWESNAKKSNLLMAYVKNRLGISNVVHGGDILDYDSNNPYMGVKHMREWLNEARASFGDGLLLAQGNHDNNTGSGSGNQSEMDESVIPYKICEKVTLGGYRDYIVQETTEDILKRISSITFENDEDKQNVIAWYKTHFYYDDNIRKIRYIILNHGTNHKGVIFKYFNVRQFGVEYLQLDWLYETLMSTPNNYDVVVVNHTFINWENNIVQAGPKIVTSMLNGCKRKDENYSFYNYEDIGTTYPLGTHSYNFKDAPNIGKVICLGGDAHWDFACKMVYDSSESSLIKQINLNSGDSLSNNDILVVHTQTDAYARTYPSGTYISDTWEMTADTVAEQCFDIVSIGQTRVHLTRIGAGLNRIFYYD